MLNLAGSSPKLVEHVVTKELHAAGVDTVYSPELPRGEVKSPVYGSLRFADGQEITVTRLWYYAPVCLAKPLQFIDAKLFNQTWGREVRVDGFAGGQLVRGDVRSWHVDSVAGLTALVALLRELHGEPLPQPKTDPPPWPGLDFETKSFPVSMCGDLGLAYLEHAQTCLPCVAGEDGKLRIPVGPSGVSRMAAALFDIIGNRDATPPRRGDSEDLEVRILIKRSDFGDSFMYDAIPEWQDIVYRDLSEPDTDAPWCLNRMKEIVQSHLDRIETPR